MIRLGRGGVCFGLCVRLERAEVGYPTVDEVPGLGISGGRLGTPGRCRIRALLLRSGYRGPRGRENRKGRQQVGSCWLGSRDWRQEMWVRETQRRPIEWS